MDCPKNLRGCKAWDLCNYRLRRYVVSKAHVLPRCAATSIGRANTDRLSKSDPTLIQSVILRLRCSLPHSDCDAKRGPTAVPVPYCRDFECRLGGGLCETDQLFRFAPIVQALPLTTRVGSMDPIKKEISVSSAADQRRLPTVGHSSVR